MTATERFNKWTRKMKAGIKEPFAGFQAGDVFAAGYAQGMSDAKAMRGRCKQCKEAIEDGTGATGIVKSLLTDAHNWRNHQQNQREREVYFERQYQLAMRGKAKLEETLQIYRQNIALKIEDAGVRTWRVVMPHTPGVDQDGEINAVVFHGRALEALEFFVKAAFDAGRRGG